jgi:enoyl-CoA hydratase
MAELTMKTCFPHLVGFGVLALSVQACASSGPTFSHPEIAFGDVVYSPLHDLVGGAVARELALTGRVVDAQEARRLGLVASVVPPAELEGEVARYARLITRAPREYLLRTKAKIIRRAGIPPGATLDL